jgi:hypothetical protein
VTSIIECPDQIPAIGFVELLHLLTTVFGTFETCRIALAMSVDGGGPEVAGRPSTDAIDPHETSEQNQLTAPS